MNFLANTLAVFTLTILVLLSMLGTKNMELKEERKENWDLVEDNKNLKKKIDDLEEKNDVLKIRIDSLRGK